MRSQLTILMGLLLAAGPLAGAPAKGNGDVEALVRGTLRHYDLNQKEKFIIDFYFSPLHAMRAYRELLLWAGREGAPAGRVGEIHSLVSDGILAVYRDSGAGVALEAGPPGAIGIAFARSLPRHTQVATRSEPESLLWPEEGRVTVTGPAAVGQSLAAKAVWLHRAGGPGSRVVAESLAAELAAATAPPFLITEGETAYAPEQLTWERDEWRVEDRRSRLFSQASLLLGLLDVKRLLADEAALSPLLHQGRLGGRTPADWQRTVDDAVTRLVEGMLRHHQDPQSGVLVEAFGPGEGRSQRVILEDLGLATEALGAYVQIAQQESAEQGRAVLRQQALFLREVLPENGLAPRGWILPARVAWRGTVATLSEQVAAQTVLYEAAEATGEATFADTARTLREAMQTPFWAAPIGIYRSAAGYTVSAYDGYLFGSVLRWLGGLAQRGEAGVPDAGHFIDTVIKRAGLLQCEGPGGGEPADPEAIIGNEAAALAAELDGLTLEERGRRMTALIAKVVDRDADSVPGCGYGGGNHGAAPVLILQTSIKTPFPPPEAPIGEEVR